MGNEKGTTLIEILVGILVITILSVTVLNVFANALGGIGKQGNRRAALEVARQRLEELTAASISNITPSDTSTHWLTCTVQVLNGPCTWTIKNANVVTPETVAVSDLATQRMETTVQLSSSSPLNPSFDILNLGVKVWFTSRTGSDDDFDRVYLKTLRH